MTQIVLEVDMRRVRLENLDGRTRDERETCIPSARPNNETKGAGLR